ncbi:hypothetical protein LX32DRAFT_647133 [Colletotrichum zoysiae]|uniref:Uncharacterized protein n=1 Tax=Colletotrichum zoysiae TaxID=1216348 RepID=A0AAD9H1I6_9PEZI|nr:hypothetical protein LX32DRAFT_647133 [Colletotrichum zoysiae]
MQPHLLEPIAQKTVNLFPSIQSQLPVQTMQETVYSARARITSYFLLALAQMTILTLAAVQAALDQAY